MESTNLMVINGNELPFEPGETILDVARRGHIDVPTLCHLKGTTPTGACRICVVEVKGARTLLPACSTPAAPNMVVRTESAGGGDVTQRDFAPDALFGQSQLRRSRTG